MRIQRIGYTPLKGGRHQAHDAVELGPDGPAGDRTFCLVDRARGRVLRTIQNPSLVQARVRWYAGVLTVDLPRRTVEGSPAPTGERVRVDYWGREADLELQDGPWAAAYSEHLGFEVALARVARAGEVVYGAPVSLVTTSALRRLGERLGAAVDPARFRATVVVDTLDGDPVASGSAGHPEDGWHGRRLRLGEAQVQVRGAIPRCAVVDLDPDKGVRDLPVLRELTGYRQHQDGPLFGVDAVVTAPGTVRAGDPVELERD
jgi:uncharacterized protein YcbX